MRKSQVIGSIVLEIIGAKEEHQQLMLEIAQALNKRNSDTDSRGAKLREALTADLQPVAQAVEQFLEPFGAITINIDQSLTKKQVDGFFQTREGLYVEEDFNQFFGNASVTEVPAQMELSKFRLTKNMDDSAIRNELPDGHVFGAYEFRAMLAPQLTKQWGGKDGVFRTDGLAEIFYVKTDDGRVLAVSVGWRSSPACRRWSVYVWSLDGSVWPAESSVCSRN